MKLVNRLLSLLTIVLIIPSVVAGQTQLTTTPHVSPEATVTQKIGLSEVSLTYFRPSVKDREIWGKLVPYGQVWRAGANDNTVISFSETVRVEGKELPAGTYGLHMIPGESASTVIFSNNSTAWGSYSYNPKEDALQVTAATTSTEKFYEFLTFEFESHTKDAAVCALKWADKKISFEISIDLEQSSMASLRRQLQNKAGWSWQGWHEAASYCLNNDFNHEEGLQWATRSVFMSPNPRNLITKARLVGKVGVMKEKVDDELTASLESLDRDLKAMPCTWKEWQGAANYAMQQDQYEKALDWISQSLKMHPNMTNMMVKAKILRSKGAEADADVVEEKAIAKGTNAELNNYGYQLLFGGNPKKAVKIFEANAKKYPEDPNVWDSLGEGYVGNGDKEKAIEALNKSLSLNPPANVRANSMKLLRKLGAEPTDMDKP